MLCGPARATPPSDALIGQIGADKVAIYAGDTPLGVCIIMEQQKPGQAWFQFTGHLGCGVDQSKIDAKGGPVGWIEYMRPDINAVLAAQYGGSAGVAGQVNTALGTAFRIVGNALVPR